MTGSTRAQGLAHHQAGRLADAERAYRAALAENPADADSLHLLGLIAHQAGHEEDAVNLIGRAIAHDSTVAEYHFTQGTVMKAMGRLDDAIACFRQAIALKPDHPDALNNLGNVLMTAHGHPDEAIACYRKAIACRPDYPEALSNLGGVLLGQRRPDEAIVCLRKAIALKPDYPEAHFNLGISLEAIASGARQARSRVRDRPTRPETALSAPPPASGGPPPPDWGQIEQRYLDEAIDCYRKAIACKPDYPQALTNLGNALMKANARMDEAIACFRTAIALKPDYAQAHYNLGVVLAEQRCLDEAIACYRKAIALEPDYAEALSNLGGVLVDQRRLEEAVACYRKSIALKPNYAEAHLNLSLALLTRGEMSEGWKEYEWRWRRRQTSALRRDFPQPQWRGEAGSGQTLLLHAEQGFGDTLQFCRYAPLAAARGLRVIVQVPKPLVRLLTCLSRVDHVLAEDEALPAFDLHCPMMSLPLAFNTTLKSIPAGIYLSADDAAAARLRARVDGAGRRVGVVWAGNPRLHMPAATAIDRRRSIPPALLAPLASVPGIRFVSLQKGGTPAATGLPMIDLMDEMTDFADTAALIATLDLVISVDTAVAHLAAALGRPVWLLDRYDSCWRWLMRRRDSPWYPTLRIYRQPSPGDWHAVIAAVAADLGRLR